MPARRCALTERIIHQEIKLEIANTVTMISINLISQDCLGVSRLAQLAGKLSAATWHSLCQQKRGTAGPRNSKQYAESDVP